MGRFELIKIDKKFNEEGGDIVRNEMVPSLYASPYRTVNFSLDPHPPH